MAKLIAVMLSMMAISVQAAPLVAQQAAAISPQALTATMEKAFPGVKISDIQSTPVPGIVEVEVNGSDRAYLTRDGKYMFVGSLFELQGDKVVNLTEQRLAGIRTSELKKLKADDMVTFKAVGKQKAQVYVFTDVTCPYCEKFHQGIKAINDMGITVHYLAFPRAGIGSKVAEELTRVWCAKDPQAALTLAKQRRSVKDVAQRDQCVSPVQDQYLLGQQLGVRGTPSIMTVDGKELGGYLSPEQLAAKLGLNG